MRNSDSAARLARKIIEETTIELAEQACPHRDDREQQTTEAPVTQTQPAKRRHPMRAVVLAVIVLMLFPPTRSVLLDWAGVAAEAAMAVVMFLIGCAIAVVVLMKPRRR